MPLPAADQLFGATAGATPPTPKYALPSADQLFAAANPQSGAAQDDIWSSLQTAGARILNSAGYGAAQAWGARPLGLDTETEAKLKELGIFNDYKDGHDSFLKSVNEAWIRPAASLADLAARGFGIPAAFAGAGAALTQTGEEVEGRAPNPVQHFASGALKAGGELSYGASEGMIGPESGFGLAREEAIGASAEAASTTERLADAARARSVGALGEGEAGFYGAEPITPENIQARTEAAQEAGEPAPPPPLPPAPDIHALARRIDPETFEQYDALALERDRYRDQVLQLGEERIKSPEAQEAMGDINRLLGFEDGQRARPGETRSRIAAFNASASEDQLAIFREAQDRLRTALKTDSPEMAEARSKMMDADFAMRDLAEPVSAAYRQAADIMPAPGEMAKGAEEAKPPEPVVEGEKATASDEASKVVQAEQQQAVAIGATPEGQAAVAAPDVVGEAKVGEVGAGTGEATKTTRGLGAMKPVEGTGETLTRGLSEHVEAKAIEDGLTTAFGDLPEYRRLSMAEQAQSVAKLIDQDYQAAKDIAMGRKTAPSGILPESVFVGVEKRALAEGDVETIRQLATRSRLNTAATTMGQRIRTLGERDQASPLGAIQEVQKAREAAVGKNVDLTTAKAETVAEIQSELKKAASTADKWASFLQTITCAE